MIYWLWILRGVYHSLVCFFVPFLVFGGLPWGSTDFLPSGLEIGLFGFGVVVFYCVVFVVSAEVWLESKCVLCAHQCD